MFEPSHRCGNAPTPHHHPFIYRIKGHARNVCSISVTAISDVNIFFSHSNWRETAINSSKRLTPVRWYQISAFRSRHVCHVRNRAELSHIANGDVEAGGEASQPLLFDCWYSDVRNMSSLFRACGENWGESSLLSPPMKHSSFPRLFHIYILTLHLSSRLENKHGWASNRKHFQQLNWPAYWTLVYSSADYNRYFQYNFVIASPGIWPNQIWRVTEAGTVRGRNIKSNGANGISTPPVLLEENTVTSSILKSVV